MIGIGITTHNRRKIALKTVQQVRKFAPKNSKIVVVDDASDIPFPNATFRFDENVGVARAKNKCLELLQDCDYIFLFDDDCYPIKSGWELPYIESGVNHLSFTFHKLSNGRSNNRVKIGEKDNLVWFRNPCGCMMFLTKTVLDTVGGFDNRFQRYGLEHLEYSTRIFNAGLTPQKYIDVKNSLDYFYSLDYHLKTQSSVLNKSAYVRKNRALFFGNKKSKEYCDFKQPVKKEYSNVILTAFFNSNPDPQRRTKWKSDISLLKPLIKSCKKNKIQLVIFHDCFSEPDSKFVDFIKVTPPRHFVPNNYRRHVFSEWLEENKCSKVFAVDSTDVEVLKNPFPKVEPGFIYCGDEKGQKFDNVWMKRNQLPYFKSPLISRMMQDEGEKQLLNCGVIGGCYEEVRELFKSISDNINKYQRSNRNSIDMISFNYTVRKNYKDTDIIHGSPVTSIFKAFEEKPNTWFRHK